MLVAHIGGVPVEESLVYVLPIAVIVGFIYWSGFRERRRSARDGAQDPGESGAVEDLTAPAPADSRGSGAELGREVEARVTRPG